MAINKVDIYVSQLQDDLNNGLTWLKRDDLGYGSIQEKYNAKEQQIAALRKHPSLKDLETNITVFNVIDDTKDKKAEASKEQTSTRSNNPVEKPVVVLEPNGTSMAAAYSELAAFENL